MLFRHGRLAPVVAALVLALAARASANGRFPTSTSVNFQPGNTTNIYLGTTFGLLLSHDDGATFYWTCEQNIGYAGTFDPKYDVAADGTIYATTFDGLRISRDGGCSFETATEGTSMSSPGYIAGIWLDALDVGADGAVWVGSTEAGRPNDIYRSTDGGRNFAPLGLASSTIWWKSIAAAEDMPLRAYVTGYQVTQTADDGGSIPPTVHLLRTDDGGANWTPLAITSFTLGMSPLLLVEAVDPDDPDTVYARSVRASGPGDLLYRSTDAGATWNQVLASTDTIRSVVIRKNDNPDTGEVLVATLMGIHRSTDNGATFAAMPTSPQAACLGDRGDQLFSCGANWEPDLFTLGRSSDDAASWSKVVRFVEIKGPLACPAGTVQRDVCEAQLWPALREQFGIPPEDGGVDAPGPPRDDGTCCDARPGGSALAPVALVALALFVPRRRRRTARS